MWIGPINSMTRSPQRKGIVYTLKEPLRHIMPKKYKGELVHNGTKSDVSFPNANAYRRFMFGLPKREMGCDVTEWTWTQQQGENGPLKLMTGFTISILINEGWTDEDVNVLPESDVSPLFYSTRDIQKGEELLTTYETLYSTDHDAVGLMWK
mmetsp:Transcript_10961/g.18727  ORF Transcript_10961/g.18727 Transcript_10961/m.18727 type:complete len:152 (-) Transcript_10961:180-635(-)